MNDDNPISLIPADHSKLKVGQRWTYHTRPVEPDSTLVIVALDRQISRIIVNISIEGLNAGNDLKGVLAPIALENLEGELTDMIEEGIDVSKHQESYFSWKELVEQGKAGVFTSSPAAIVATIASG